jgi:lincosamide nucleotidyltransferase A/C/D/E
MAHNIEVGQPDVIEFYTSMEACGITVWIDGGWGVDALLGKQTRLHKDLDIAVQEKDVAILQDQMKSKGYRDITLEIARPHNFVLGDHEGHK